MRAIRIVHLFPDLLSTYGDSGNLRALVVRAEHRAIHVSVERVTSGAAKLPDADLLVIGGGEDRDQAAVEIALRRLHDGLVRQVEQGAALLAVCAGYQNLGRSFRTRGSRTRHGPGIFAADTEAGRTRLVGPVLARLEDDAGLARSTVVGFENHAGRTVLDDATRPFASIEIGHGNNGSDRTEGAVVRPAHGTVRGLRIGTYLHGPLLPRNPHVADLLLRAALARTGQPTDLSVLDDSEEWRAHDRFVAQMRHRTLIDRMPAGVRRVVDPARRLIGF